MGNPLFGINISKLINDNVGTGVLDATLTKVTESSRTGGSLDDGRVTTTTTFACKGFIDQQMQRGLDGTLVDDGTKTIVLIGDSINGGAAASAPDSGDRITIEGTEYNIQTIDRDPAAATYTCICRRH